MKFMFGVPSVDGRYDVHVVTSIINQLAYITEEHHGILNRMIVHTLIHNARNQIALSAIEQGCDYLLFIDADCVLPVDALKRLVAHDKDIVAGMYFGKVEPFPPVVYKKTEKGLYRHFLEYPKDELVEVDCVGMGCCLIKTEVLKNFVCDREKEYADHTISKVKESYAFEPMPSPDNNRFVMGEDASFCRRCQDLGYRIYVDTGIQCKHQGMRYVTEEYHVKTKERIRAAEQGGF